MFKLFTKRKENINLLKWEIEQLWDLVDLTSAEIYFEEYTLNFQKVKLSMQKKSLKQNKKTLMSVFPVMVAISANWAKGQALIKAIKEMEYYVGLQDISEEQIYKIKYYLAQIHKN